jgi:hypothetical protein
VLWIFTILKNLLFSDGFEPANPGSNGKHATTRPPRVTSTHIRQKQCQKKKKKMGKNVAKIAKI